MTAVAAPVRPTTARGRRTGAVVGALARVEVRRMLRNPVLWLCAGLAVWLLWIAVPTEGEWPGASYEEMTLTSAPLLPAISVVVALSFHRERREVAAAAPVRESHRALARLVAATPLVALMGCFAALMAWRQRDLGGLWLGQEPGFTAEALFTPGELCQQVALGVLAVSAGAAVGRRLVRIVSAITLLFVSWFVVNVYWLFADPAVTPFSIVQVQPIRLVVGTASADPLSFPSGWLLEGPTEFGDHWSRQFVSESLAWGHDVWLLGLSLLLLATAAPRPARRWLLVGGLATAALGVVVQVSVIP